MPVGSADREKIIQDKWKGPVREEVHRALIMTDNWEEEVLSVAMKRFGRR